MKLILSINLDGDAFAMDDGDEIRRLFGELAVIPGDFSFEHALRDINGNPVGTCEVVEKGVTS